MTKTILLSLTYLIGIGELILSGYFWKTNSKNEIRRVMALLALTTGLWVLSTAINAYAPNSAEVQFRDKFTYAFGVLIVTALLNFALLFPIPIPRLDRFHYLFLYLPVIIFIYILFSGNYLIGHYYSSVSLSGKWVGGPLYGLYNGYLLLLYSLSVLLLFSKLKLSDGINRRNLSLVLWSVVLGGFPAVLFDLVVPLVTNIAQYPLIGTTSTVFWLGFTAYILLKS